MIKSKLILGKQIHYTVSFQNMPSYSTLLWETNPVYTHQNLFMKILDWLLIIVYIWFIVKAKMNMNTVTIFGLSTFQVLIIF